MTGPDAAARRPPPPHAPARRLSTGAEFVVGDIQALPFEDDSFDVALSVFGLIFAGDARRGFDEMMRVLRPSGRALFSVWAPAGSY